MKGRLAPLVLISLLPSCSWVSVTEAGSAVAVLGAAPDPACRGLGIVTARTKATVAGTARSEEKILEELDVLARNEAATLGANVVVPTTDLTSGRRAYDAFLCPETGR